MYDLPTCSRACHQDSKNHTCVDVNECEIVDEVCGAGECRNTDGSFSCHCRDGHRADELTKVCVGPYSAANYSIIIRNTVKQ